MRISKELFEAVIDNKVKYYCVNVDEIEYDYESFDRQNPLIMVANDFSFKCKEWAHKKGFSYIGNDGLINIHSSDNKIIAIINNNIKNWFDIEIDIIACNWILENSSGNTKTI